MTHIIWNVMRHDWWWRHKFYPCFKVTHFRRWLIGIFCFSLCGCILSLASARAANCKHHTRKKTIRNLLLKSTFKSCLRVAFYKNESYEGSKSCTSKKVSNRVQVPSVKYAYTFCYIIALLLYVNEPNMSRPFYFYMFREKHNLKSVIASLSWKVCQIQIQDLRKRRKKKKIREIPSKTTQKQEEEKTFFSQRVFSAF